MAPSSVSTASTVTQGLVTLPLFKFSYCTSPNPQAKMIWTHLPQRSDMFAVFDVIRKVGTSMVVSETNVLKIVRGADLLQQIDFPDLQDQVRLDKKQALHQHISDVDLRVLVIVKRPLLALRYSLPDGQIRKTQMNFVPESGCDVALETLKTAGLPIRDKSLPQVQAQRPQSSQTQPRSQDRPDYMKDGQVQRLQSSQSQPQYQKRPGSSNTGHSARPQSLDGAFQGSSQTLLQEPTGGWNSSIPPSSQPTGVNIRPLSAPGGLDQDEFSRPISALSRPTLDVSGSTTAVSAMAVVAKPRTKSGLLPSPVFNGTYEPFGSFQVRPVSAPEQIQTQRNYSNTLPLSQMLPPERTLPFPEKKIHPFRRDEATSQEEPSQEKPATTKTNASKQTKPRAQPAKPRKSRAKIGAETISSDPLAPSSPLNYQPPKTLATAKVPSSSAPPRVSTPESQAIPSSSDPLALSIPKSRKRALTEQSVNQPNKRQAQTVSDTATKTIRETLTAAVPEHGPREQRPQDIDPLITTTVDTSDQDLLGRVDDLVRSFRDVPAPTSEPRTAKDYLAKYAAHCDEDRAKAIDNYMCECIKNDDFWKLMDDVEGSWKRLGFGL